MGFEKAHIKRYIPDGEIIDVMFNPNEYRLSISNQFAEMAVPGLAAPPLQFTRGNATTLSMQLFFDTYEKGVDVREYTDKITNLLEIDSDLHAPPICQFAWGKKLTFVGVLERADQRYTLFFPDGRPARATIDVTFKEFSESQKQLGKLQSTDFAKLYVVRCGDTLSSIAGQKFGDPTRWRLVAEENQIDNPLAIQPGQVLKIPAS